MFGVCGLCRLFPLVILSSQRPCQEVKVALCQLSASCIAAVGIEGEVGHEVVGYDVADKFAWHLVYVGYEEVGLCLFSVVHRVVLVLDVFGAVHDGAEFAFFYAGNVEDDVLCFLRQWGFAAFRHLQLFFQKPLVGIRGLEEENLFLVQS